MHIIWLVAIGSGSEQQYSPALPSDLLLLSKLGISVTSTCPGTQCESTLVIPCREDLNRTRVRCGAYTDVCPGEITSVQCRHHHHGHTQAHYITPTYTTLTFTCTTTTTRSFADLLHRVTSALSPVATNPNATVARIPQPSDRVSHCEWAEGQGKTPISGCSGSHCPESWLGLPLHILPQLSASMSEDLEQAKNQKG